MTIYRMVRSGELKAIKPTGKRAMRIERGSVEKIARRYVN
jgi:excisionase family DNA binding protein